MPKLDMPKFFIFILLWKRIILNDRLSALGSIILNDRLSALGSIKRSIQIGVQSWGRGVSYKHPVNTGTNLNKRKRRTFVFNFGRNFGRNFVFVKNLLPWHFLFLIFHFLISTLFWLSAQSEKAPIQEVSFLNKRLGY